MHTNPSDDDIRALLTKARTIAVVGASNDPQKASHGVMRRLQRHGYRVIPVNPRHSEVLGVRAYASLLDIPEHVDIVDVFRPSSDTPPFAEQAAQIGAKVLWLQLGIANQDAATRATDAGLTVVMNDCIAVSLAMLRVPPIAQKPGA